MHGEKIVPQPILPPLSKLPVVFRSREEALAAPGDVRLHFKGGIYRKLGIVLNADQKLRPLAIYEHLWPHAHQYYVRDNEEFEGMKNLGEDRGEVEWVARFAKVVRDISSTVGSTESSATSASTSTSS